VNLDSVNTIDGEQRAGNLKEETRGKKKPLPPALTLLSNITDQAALSALTPELQRVLQTIDNSGCNILQTMSANIACLQDAFLDAASCALEAANVDLSRKITLRLNQRDELAVAGEHPDKEALEAILAQNPELAAAFKEISSQSEVLRDVGNIGKVIGVNTGISSYQRNSALSQNTAYQISIKGEMSHFYFAKN
jgi:hypothetical protein